MSFRLRDYQAECVEAISAAHEEHDAVLCELPTGTGKTEIFVEYSRRFPRTMIVAPWLTLIDQAAKKIKDRTGEWPAIEQGKLWANEGEWGRLPHVVASKASLTRISAKNPHPRYLRFHEIDLVIVDEAHYSATRSYRDMLQYFRAHGAKVLGVTATAKRHDETALGEVYDTVAYQYPMITAIEDGWLCRPRVICKQLESLDLTAVETAYTVNGKDFNLCQLNEQLEQEAVLLEIAAATAESTRDQKTAVYCSSVAEAEAVSGLLNDRHGIKSGWVCADTKKVTKVQWRDTMDAFRAGELTHICNVGQLTVGWDFPGLQAIVMGRPTKSLPLYIQIMGRGTRPLPGTVDFPDSTPATRKHSIERSRKPFFRVIDLVDNSLEHKIVTAPDVLEGKYSIEAIARMKSEADSGDEFDLSEAAIRAEEDVHVRMENRRLRARVAAQVSARFRDTAADPFGHGRVASSGRRAGAIKTPATDKQRKLLWVRGIKDVDQLNLSKAQASRMIGQLIKGTPVAEVRRTNRL